MQFKVPQNVQMEDKIVGPLTLKQMLILGAGGGMTYVVYLALARTYFWEVWIVPVAVVVVITLAFAFVKFYNVTFGRFIILFIQFLMIPRKRIWIKKSGDVFMQDYVPKVVAEYENKAEIKGKKAEQTMKKLKDISKILDSYGKPIKK